MSTHPSSRGWEKEEREWEIVPTDWWRTPYTAVSWVFTQDPAGGKKFHRHFRGSLFLGPRGWRRVASSRDTRGDGDTTLNVDLVGVKSALEAVVTYERNVGFYYRAFPKIELHELESLSALNMSIDEEETRAHQIRWNTLLSDLMHAPLPEPNDSDESSELAASCSSVGDFFLQSTSTLSSVDLTSSEGSIESHLMPSTPRAKSSSHHHIEIKDVSPPGSVTGKLHISPVRSLSASASSFIPTSSSQFSSLNEETIKFPSLQDPSATPSKPSSFGGFTFPTLNPPVSSTSSSSVRLKKDSDGFFTEDGTVATPTSLLPPFLQESSHRSTRTRKSRTREIVDRLKSELGPNEEGINSTHKVRNTVSPKYASYSPSPLIDDFAAVMIKPRRSVSEDGSGEPRHQHRPTTSLSASALASASVSTSRLSSPEMEDDDGWIDITHPTPATSSPKEKSKRTRELFMALTRRRTDSASSEVLKEIIDGSTNCVAEGVDVVGEDCTEMSTSSSLLSPPSTPPPAKYTDTVSVSTSPPLMKTSVSSSSDGWIETSSVVREPSSPNVQKYKISKRDMHHKKKSSAQNANTPPWARSVFQHPPLPISHPLQHQPNPSLSSYPSTAYTQHPRVLAHTHPHMMPSTVSGPGAGATPVPYFFPSYPGVGVAVPVSPVAYSTAYNVMHVPTAYAMPAAQTYVAPPLGNAPSLYGHGGLLHATTSPLSAVKAASGFTTTGPTTTITTTAAAMPMPVPVGTGLGGINGSSRGKVSTGSW